MSTEDCPSRTLVNNDIKQFILRIDFQSPLPTIELVEALKDDFSRVENRKIVGFEVAVNLPKNTSALSQKDFTDLVLVKDHLTLTLSAKDNSLYIAATSYLDNTVYKSISDRIIDVCRSTGECSAKRIGMRYINEIACPKITAISRIFKKSYSSVVRNMISTHDTNRAVAIQIRNCDDYTLRIQYGVLNKFFPAVIKNYDLLLDIDSSTIGEISIDRWSETIKKLNHAAYDSFVNIVTEAYIESKKNA